VRTVCEAADPEYPGMMNCRDEVVSPVTGEVKLQALVQEKKGSYPDIYVCDQQVVWGNPANWASINNVEFRVAGTLVGAGAPASLDPDFYTNMTTHTFRVSVPWNSATMLSCNEPQWRDGKHSAQVRAYCGASMSEEEACVSVKNKGLVFGVVKDAVTEEPIPNATIEVTCTDQAGEETVTGVVAMTSSDADGAYSVALYPGRYGIKVMQGCHVTIYAGMTFAPAEVLNLDLLLHPRLTIEPSARLIHANGATPSELRVRLVDSDGIPISHAVILLRTSLGNSMSSTTPAWIVTTSRSWL